MVTPRHFTSPLVRIGMIQSQPIIRCHVVGPYKLEDAQGHCLATLDEGSGQLEFTPQDSHPASVRWRGVLFKSPSCAEAQAFAASLTDSGCTIEEVGTAFEATEGVCLDAREWWVLSPEFEAERECRDWCRGRGIPVQQLVPRVKRPPQGLIFCQGAGITGSGLATGGLFRLLPAKPRGGRIALHGVIVGIGFHWQHLETQWLRGSLEILLDRRGHLTAVNTLGLEEYLCAVVASEMKAEMPHELLKVQAVCARNTYLATAGKHHLGDPFDLCADDHCQCYRGSSRESRAACEAVVATWGEVLSHSQRLCDTRYSKICGGITEAAHSVWGGLPIPYMMPIADFPQPQGSPVPQSLDTEQAVRSYIFSAPPAFCNINARHVPEYLQYAGKYFRWKATYTAEELGRLLAGRAGLDIGRPTELIPLRRGASGRIEQLLVRGEKGEAIIERQLEIRYALSESCLYSSCFVVDHDRAEDGTLRSVTLHGAGWGHGAGMCQIGAAVMALEGYNYHQILTHYFRDTALRQVYEKPTNWAAVLDYFNDGDFGRRNRCWEATNCYEVVGCPVYEAQIGPDKGYLENVKPKALYLQCPEYRRQRPDDPALGGSKRP